jgi:hypothetical protein
MHGLTWSKLVKLGAPKMEGQCHISINEYNLIKYNFLQQTKSVEFYENLNGSILDCARSVGLS